jgi:ferredoxin-NADP reductase
MIAMRMRKTPFKTALKSAALGTKFIVSRPRGSFNLHRDFTRPAVFLASGIGISAIRSIIRKAAQERLPHGLYLFYSNREADDAAFIEEFIFVASQGHHRHAPLFSISHSRRSLAGSIPVWSTKLLCFAKAGCSIRLSPL